MYRIPIRAIQSFLLTLGGVSSLGGQALLGIFRYRWDMAALVDQLAVIGSRSTLIVAVIAIFTGMVMALQLAVGLGRVGLKLYIGQGIGPAIVRELGPGCGLWLVLLAGAAGNLLGALARDPRHVAVGVSTATFGAIGILAALRLAGAPRRARGKRWLVLAASLLLLAMLGTSPDADVLAHGLGLLCGGALGLTAGVALRRPLGPRAQWTLAALAALAVAGAWRLALG